MSTEDEPSRAESEKESFKAMWNIQIDNHVKREKKLEEIVKNVYVMIFEQFCPSRIQNRIKEHQKYESILKYTLKIMDVIDQSMYEPIQETYPYLLLTEYLAIIMNTRQQKKEILVTYTKRFKQQKSIIKSQIGEYFLDGIVKKTKKFKKLDEVDDAEEIIEMKKNEFEAWSTMVFMRVSDKRKYGELIHDFTIQYAI